MRNGRVRSPIVVIVLTLITCGLYGLIWYHEVSAEIQDALGRRDTPPAVEVLAIFLTCGIYTIFWWYKYGRMVAELQQARGRPARDNSVLYILLSALGFWYGWLDLANIAIMQSDLNALWESSPWMA